MRSIFIVSSLILTAALSLVVFSASAEQNNLAQLEQFMGWNPGPGHGPGFGPSPGHGHGHWRQCGQMQGPRFGCFPGPGAAYLGRTFAQDPYSCANWCSSVGAGCCYWDARAQNCDALGAPAQAGPQNGSASGYATTCY